MLTILLSAVAAASASAVYGDFFAASGIRSADRHHPAMDHPRHVVFREHVLDTEAHPGFTAETHRRMTDVRRTDAEEHQFLVHFGRPLVASEMRAFEAETGTALGAYLPHHTYLVVMRGATALAVRKHALVAWVGVYHPELKGARAVPEEADVADEVMSLHVALPPVPLGAPRRDLAAAEAVAAKWNAMLTSQGLEHEVEAVVLSRDKLGIEVAPVLGQRASLRRIAELVADQPESHFIEEKPHFVTMNKFAAGVTQGGAEDKQTLWERGLTGTGQIVGVGDSGLDHDACQFRDPARATPITTGRSNAGGIDLQHRKIVNYHAFNGADQQDDVDGHGTHVAGSAIGGTFDQTSPIANYDGMAKDAKVAFFDIGLTGGGLSGIPNDLNANYYPLGYDAGARIHTNSWGVPCAGRAVCYRDGSGLCQANAYTTNAAETDTFMYDNPDFLVLFAAGNDGASACTTAENNGFNTVASPATAKNILSVGATQNTNSARLEYCEYLGGSQNCLNFYSSQADIYNSDSMAYFSSRGPTRDLRIKPDISAPGNPVFSARSDGNTNTNNCGEDPDDVLLSGGTSMATPIVAGNAALVRQYLAEGWYPSGAPTPADAVEPSAALVKAVVINGGQAMAGYVDILGDNQFSQLDSTPSLFYGFGRLQLDKTLFFNDATEEAGRLLYIKQTPAGTDPVIAQGQSQESCLTVVDASVPVKFSLVWTDPPASPSTGIVLVNNLDLVVTLDGTTQTWLGNEPYGAKIGEAGQADRRNNVEQVVIDAPTAGEYCATVTATAIGSSNGEQQYALVGTGGFTANLDQAPPQQPPPGVGDDDDDNTGDNIIGDDDDSAGSGRGGADGDDSGSDATTYAIYGGGAIAGIAVVAGIGVFGVRTVRERQRQRSQSINTPFIANRADTSAAAPAVSTYVPPGGGFSAPIQPPRPQFGGVGYQAGYQPAPRY